MTIQNHVLTPEELGMVQQVYKGIVRQDWFDRTVENEQACAVMVLHYFQRGMIVESILARMCESAARERFRKPI